MFINRSVFPQISAPMTREIVLALNDYSGLVVYSGESDKADAILLGIIESKDHYTDAVKTTQTLFTDEELQKSIGSRQPFYFPIQSTYSLWVRFILIKKPSKQELELFSGDMGKMVKAHPRVVLMDQIDLTNSFSRVASSNSGVNAGGEVNFVKNKAIFDKSLQDTCLQAAQSFKQVILNAF